MTGPTHIVFAYSTSLAARYFFDLPLEGLDWLMIGLGALAPDVDEKSSTISQPGKILERWFNKTIIAPLNFLGKVTTFIFSYFFSHRGPTHWPIVGLLILMAGLTFQSELLAWFGFAYLTHLFADYCTVMGIPLLGPYSEKKYSCLPITTGSKTERYIFIFFLIAVYYFGFDKLPEETQFWLKRYSRTVANYIS